MVLYLTRLLRGLHVLGYLAVTIMISSCHHIDDEMIPAVPVQIVFTDIGMWNTYGVSGALDYRTFIRQENRPAGFFYTATTYTGYGGVLLVGDVYGNPQAFDLSCPVEHQPDVRIYIDSETHNGVCPKCGSTYDVFENLGYPLSGPAAKHGYGLTRYNVYSGAGTTYRVISR